MYGNEDQTSALLAGPAQVTMLASRPSRRGGERSPRHAPGPFGWRFIPNGPGACRHTARCAAGLQCQRIAW